MKMKTDGKEWRCIIAACIKMKVKGDNIFLRNDKHPEAILKMSRAEWDEMKKKIKDGEI